MDVSFNSLLAVYAINFCSVFVFAMTGFGNAILFQVGWRIGSIIDDKLFPEDSGALIVVYITMAAFFLFPLQSWIFRRHINWKLFIHLTLSQQLGLYFGIYVIFSMKSDWFTRVLGVLFFMVAVQNTFNEATTAANDYIKARSNSEEIESPSITQSIDEIISFEENEEIIESAKFKMDTSLRYLIVWSVGISSGVLGGLFATGGPPLMWFISYFKIPSNECRATLG